jgi:charged multivesicular body protein 6
VRATYERAVAQLDSVEATLASVESATLNVQIAESLKAGNAAIKELHAKLGGLDGVESLLGETEELIADQAAIDEALGADADALAGLTAADLDAIEAELAALGEGEREREAGRVGVAAALADAPAVPTTELPSAGEAVTVDEPRREAEAMAA